MAQPKIPAPTTTTSASRCPAAPEGGGCDEASTWTGDVAAFMGTTLLIGKGECRWRATEVNERALCDTLPVICKGERDGVLRASREKQVEIRREAKEGWPASMGDDRGAQSGELPAEETECLIGTAGQSTPPNSAAGATPPKSHVVRLLI